MSPRKNNILTIEGWAKLKKGKLYKGKVKKVIVNKKNKSLLVTIENLDPSQLGRIHDIELPLPVRPGSKAYPFINACGIDAGTIGTKICLDDLSDAIIGIRFSTNQEDAIQQVDFKKIEKSSNTAGTFEQSQKGPIIT
jgi:hypothetical protein